MCESECVGVCVCVCVCVCVVQGAVVTRERIKEGFPEEVTFRLRPENEQGLVQQRQGWGSL